MSMSGNQWPLSGRDAVLDEVGEYLRQRGCSGVVLVGGPGVGKTRLGVECLTRAQSMSYTTRRVRATRSVSHVPFGAFGAMLPPVNAARRPRETACLLSHVVRSIPCGPGSEPLALLVDDAHLLDAESAMLVHQLATRCAAFLILTMCSGAVPPGPLVALWKDETLARLDLCPLGRPDIGALLSAVTGGPVDGSTAHRLAERSGGNLHLLRELVQSALDSGALYRDGGIWRLVSPPPMSARLVELVESVLSGLSHAEREALEVSACAGAIGVEELAHLVGAPCIEALERRGALTVDRRGRRREVGLAYPLQGDVLRETMPLTREQAVCRALADVVEAAGMHRREDMLRVVGWRLQGGGEIPTAFALAAAWEAQEDGDLELAARLADAAVERGGGFDAALIAASVASLEGRADVAELMLKELTALAHTEEQRATLAVSRAGNLLMRGGRPDDALTVLLEAEQGIQADEWREEVSAKRALVLVCLESADEALTIAEPLMHGATGDALSEACVVSAIGHARAGRHAAALQACRVGAEQTPGARDKSWPQAHWIHAWNRCEILVRLGDLDGAEREARSNYEQALVHASHAAHAAFAQCLSLVSRGRGDMAKAVVWAREAVGVLRRRPGGYPIRWALAELASALILAGEVEDAAEALGEYDARMQEPQAPLGVPIEHARAWLAAARGELALAHSELRDLAARASAHGSFGVEAAALHDLVRLGALEDVPRRLSELAVVVEGPLMRGQVQHAIALGAMDGRAADAASTQFERIGALLLAAEAAASAAQVWCRSGEKQRAAASERRAAHLARRCEGAVTPALAMVQTRTALTAREREVAALAAAGLSNRDITRQLFVSVRTVENQLQRAYTKLGVRSRTELAGALELQLSP